MKLNLFIFYGIISNFVWIIGQKLSQEIFRDFSQSLCGDHCGNIECPLRTVMKIQSVDIFYDIQTKTFCYSNESMNTVSSDNAEPDQCKHLLRIEWSQYVANTCNNQSRCSVCPTEKMKKNVHGKCTYLSNILVNYLCISNTFTDEIVTDNSYVDLNCETFVENRIVIHKASLTSQKVTIQGGVDNSPEGDKNRACSQLDVSSVISKQCSLQKKCQAGPDRLVSNGCEKKQLVLQYACVPQSVLKIDTMGSQHQSDSGKGPTKNAENIQVDGIALVKPTEGSSEKSLNKINNSTDQNQLWIIISITIAVVVLVIVCALVWTFGIRKWRTRQSSLFYKIKDANFCPPPTSIEKIQIDLSPENPLYISHSNDYNTLLHNEVIHQLQCSQKNCDHFTHSAFKNQVSIHSNFITNSSNSSNGAGSSGQISSLQSDSSKGNPSTIFNYLSSEKNPPIQTYI